MPVSSRSRRTRADHVEAGAVLELQVGDDDVGLRARRTSRAPRRPSSRRRPPPWSARRQKTMVRPSRIRSWSSTSSTRVGLVVGHAVTRVSVTEHRRLGAGGRRRAAARSRPCRAGRPSVIGSSAPTSRARSCMISRPWESERRGPSPEPSSRTTISAVGGVDLAPHHDRRRAGVPDRVGHRLLGDPQQLGLDLGAQPGGALVDADPDRDPGAVAEVPGEAADGGTEAVALADLGAQALHRAPYLGDDAGDPLAQHAAAGPPARRVADCAAMPSTR